MRARVERAQTAALAALHAMPEDAHGTMLWDYCETCIETLTNIGDAYHDVRIAISDAVHERHGYDTWDSDALEEMIQAMNKLRDAMQELRDALAHLANCELWEYRALSANNKGQPRPTE